MNLNQAVSIIKKAIDNKIVVMLHGSPGIGKSSIIEQLALDNKLILNDQRLAQLDPTDLRGIPVANRDNHTTDWFTPDFWPKSKADGTGVDGPGLIFLDEIDKASVSVKNAALQLVLNRRIGQYKVPSDWAIVCAGNNEEDGAFTIPLGSALTNRMIHLDVGPDVATWSSWALNNNIEESIIGFVNFKPDLLYKNTGQHAFPSPRTWEMASKLTKNVNNEQLYKMLVTSAVGESTATELIVYKKVYSAVDVNAILKGDLPSFEGKDQSFKYAVTMAVAYHARKNGAKKHMNNLFKFVNILSPELRILFMKQQTRQAIVEFSQQPEFSKIAADIISSLDIS